MAVSAPQAATMAMPALHLNHVQRGAIRAGVKRRKWHCGGWQDEQDRKRNGGDEQWLPHDRFPLLASVDSLA